MDTRTTKVGRQLYALPRVTLVAVVLRTPRRAWAAGQLNDLPKLVPATLKDATWPTDDSLQTIPVSSLALGLLTSPCLDRMIDVLVEYCATFAIDELRRTDYRRLTASGETYVDWMGGALYPERLVHAHADFLCMLNV